MPIIELITSVRLSRTFFQYVMKFYSRIQFFYIPWFSLCHKVAPSPKCWPLVGRFRRLHYSVLGMAVVLFTFSSF